MLEFGEQILHNSHKQWNILRNKLGDASIEHGLKKQSRVIYVTVHCLVPPHLSRYLQYSLDGSQTEVVVVLLGELSAA